MEPGSDIPAGGAATTAAKAAGETTDA
jgi:hypothetical protein